MRRRDKKIWTVQQEQLLVTWAEKASGYAWLHTRSVSYFKRRNLYISIPAAIFGYGAGASTLLSDGGLAHPWARGLIGMSAIMSGLFSNFQEMFTFKEESEKHRVASLRFLAFFRDISCELSMEPASRNVGIDYITLKRLEFDKMLEQSPDIPECIVDKFNATFQNLSIHKPDAAIGLQTIAAGCAAPRITMRRRRLKTSDKMLLLRSFRAWRGLCQCSGLRTPPDTRIEITNSNLEDYGGLDEDSCSQDKRKKEEQEFLYLHGRLSEQKVLPRYKNIKISRSPMEVSTETSEDPSGGSDESDGSR